MYRRCFRGAEGREMMLAGCMHASFYANSVYMFRKQPSRSPPCSILPSPVPFSHDTILER